MSTDNRENNSIFTADQARRSGFQASNVLKDDFGFEVPTEAIPLPSLGRVYPVESALHTSEFIEITAMTAKEEDILTSRALIKKGTVITHLIKSCLVDKTIDVDEMISGDRNAIMTALRITGYGSEYTADVDCPACGERSKQDFNLSNLPVRNLLIEPAAEGVNLFEFELPVTKKKVHFKFLTGKDEQEIMTLQERKKKQGMQDNLVTTRLQYSLIAVDGIKDKNKIGTFIRSMPARDSLALRKFIDDNEPGVEMKDWIQCPHCDTHSEVRLPMGASFFWPDS